MVRIFQQNLKSEVDVSLYDAESMKIELIASFDLEWCQVKKYISCHAFFIGARTIKVIKLFDV